LDARVRWILLIFTGSNREMKTITKMTSFSFRPVIRVFTAVVLTCFLQHMVHAQCKPIIKIDDNATVVNQNDDFGLRLPFWLNEGQTVAVGSSVSSISIIEFTESGTTLEYSGVLNVTSTTAVSVPSGKVWKIESVAMENNSSSYKSATFSSAGTYSWTVPGCAEQICIEIWGGGGGGSGASYNSGVYPSGAGGGGGGFGSECFTVVPGTPYSVVVGAGGNGGPGTGSAGSSTQNATSGGTSSVGSLISATGGTGATYSPPGGIPGTGGSSAASSNAVGANGLAGTQGTSGLGGAGGAAGNGGAGGPAAGAAGAAGTGPGGGGAGGGYSYGTGGKGAPGKVVITW
jgi:hypothetical protein